MNRQILAGAMVMAVAASASAEVPWPATSRVPESATGVRLTLDPWADNSYVQSDSVMLLEERGHLQSGPAAGAAEHVYFSDIWGRARFSKQQSDTAGWETNSAFMVPVLGFRWASIDFGIHQPGLPSQMQDFSLVGGIAAPAGQFGVLTVIAGAGYTGNSPFNDGDAAYGIVHVADAFVLDADSKFVVSLDYNGNSGLYPDAPLPGFAYVRSGKNWQVWLGFPESSLVWKPTDSVTVELGWGMPETAGFRVTWEVVQGISLYAAADNFFSGFHYSADDRDRRLFFQQRRAEVGVRFNLGTWLDASIGGGYAWDQRLERGFDVRSIHDVAKFDDGAYVMLRIGGSF